ncbi:MAG: TIGR00270 family protein [Candidatus Micrarchaeota archaeon]|nr:TIGR00270 family protein [Candidatus Micrarchaeota archaeon]
MEDCELCGNPTQDIYVVSVEDVELRVCAKCAKGKKVISTQSDASKKKTRAPRFAMPQKKKEEDQSLVENYGAVMREARERMQIPLPVLAEMLNEKETLLLRIEQQQTLPPIALTKKLEKALKIKLIDESVDTEAHTSRGGGDKVTLGDFIVKKK